MPQIELARPPIEIEPDRNTVRGDAGKSRDAFRGMHFVDTSGNPRIPIIMEMVGELSRATEPKHVLKAFSDGLRRMNGPRGYVSISTRGLKPGEYKITRLLTEPNQHIEDSDPWRNWSNIPVQHGGFFGELIRNAYPVLIHRLYLRDDPVVGDALGKYGSMMAIPLFENGEALNWSIQLRDEPEGFTESELEEAILRANLGGATVRNVMITQQLRQANARIQREIEQIAKIQRALLPQVLPSIPGLSIAASYDTFDTAGGDMYDLQILPRPGQSASGESGASAEAPPLLTMVIADAAGHGPAAAVVSAMLNTILHARPVGGESDGPASILRHANRHLYAKQIDGMFVTAFLAVFDPLKRTLTYARAGHNPPLVKNAGSGGAVRRLDAVGGMPLGIAPDVEYESGTITLERGQTLVMYTDGIVEAMNPQRDMFGVEGIEHALEICTGEPQCVINSITTALRAHEAGVRPADDQTIVALKVE